jgi:hypothetical protein
LFVSSAALRIKFDRVTYASAAHKLAVTNGAYFAIAAAVMVLTDTDITVMTNVVFTLTDSEI